MKKLFSRIWDNITNWWYLDIEDLLYPFLIIFAIAFPIVLVIYLIGPIARRGFESVITLFSETQVTNFVLISLSIFFAFTVINVSFYIYWRRRRQIEISVADVIEWAQELEISMNQIQKSYEWRISQWSIFGKAVLTSALAFVSGATIAILRGEIQVQCVWDAINICIGIILALSTYGVSLYRIRQLRNEYIGLYRIIKLMS